MDDQDSKSIFSTSIPSTQQIATSLSANNNTSSSINVDDEKLNSHSTSSTTYSLPKKSAKMIIYSLTAEKHKKYQEGDANTRRQINNCIASGHMFIVLPDGWKFTYSLPNKYLSWLERYGEKTISLKCWGDTREFTLTVEAKPGIYDLNTNFNHGNKCPIL